MTDSATSLSLLSSVGVAAIPVWRFVLSSKVTVPVIATENIRRGSSDSNPLHPCDAAAAAACRARAPRPRRIPVGRDDDDGPGTVAASKRDARDAASCKLAIVHVLPL